MFCNDKKITGLRITANAPLLNLNLNYEKLRGKDKKSLSIFKPFASQSIVYHAAELIKS